MSSLLQRIQERMAEDPLLCVLTAVVLYYGVAAWREMQAKKVAPPAKMAQPEEAAPASDDADPPEELKVPYLAPAISREERSEFLGLVRAAARARSKSPARKVAAQKPAEKKAAGRPKAAAKSPARAARSKSPARKAAKPKAASKAPAPDKPAAAKPRARKTAAAKSPPRRVTRSRAK